MITPPLEPTDLSHIIQDDGAIIIIKGHLQIVIEKNGVFVSEKSPFTDEKQVYAQISYWLSQVGVESYDTHRFWGHRLPDGLQVRIIMPTAPTQPPYILLKSFNSSAFTINDFIRWGTITQAMAEFLRACIIGRINVLVVGEKGAGTTSLLNVMCSFIPNDERIITIEWLAELQLQHEHVIPLEGDDLIPHALKMRPERIIMGDLIPDDAFNFIDAMSVGHDGAVGIIKARDVESALSQLEMAIMSRYPDFPLRETRNFIARSIQMMVVMKKMADGSRKIAEITEISKPDNDSPNYTINPIFVYQPSGDTQKLIPTGYIPSLYRQIEDAGIHLPNDLFNDPDYPIAK